MNLAGSSLGRWELLALGSLGQDDKKEPLLEIKLWDVDTGKDYSRLDSLPRRSLGSNSVLGFTGGNKKLCFAPSQGSPVTSWDTATGKARELEVTGGPLTTTVFAERDDPGFSTRRTHPRLG